MRLSELSYEIYRASSGDSSFWRWEVVHKRNRKVPLKSGFVYGTMADAKKGAAAAMRELVRRERRG